MPRHRRDDSFRGITAILFIGDVVGRAGRRVLRELLPGLREELAPDFVIVNGENAAGGIGITPKEADEILRAGVDAITLGNHTYRHREIWPYLEEERRIVRPYNFLPTQPGPRDDDRRARRRLLGVVNLSGMVHLQAAAPPLVAIDAALREVSRADQVLVDMHAEVDEREGRAGLVPGRQGDRGGRARTPTSRPPTARVLPGGTAYITDVGMTGARGGVIGMKKEQSIAVMRTHMPMRYEPSEVDPWLEGRADPRRDAAPARRDRAGPAPDRSGPAPSA